LKNSKIISKVARFFAIVSFVFVIVSALITFYLLQIGSPSAPTEYVVVAILSSILSYLFIAILSLVISVVAGDSRTENPEKEAVHPAQPEAVNP
jgi:RsiW-degrading membrane proteinase PrsW (M82 family)